MSSILTGYRHLIDTPSYHFVKLVGGYYEDRGFPFLNYTRGIEAILLSRTLFFNYAVLAVVSRNHNF